MADKIKVATLDAVPDGAGLQVEVNGRQLGLFKVAGKVHAIDNTCVHRGGPLAEGFLSGSVVACPWHGWRFDVTDGKCLTAPQAKLACYEVTVDGSDVYVTV